MSSSIPLNTKGRFLNLVMALLCQSTQGVSVAGLPLLLPLIRQELGLNFAQGGMLSSASLLVYAIMQIPAGYFTDHYSPRKLLAIGTIGIMGLSALLAITQEYWQLLLIQLFWGFFSSFSFAPAMLVFVGWFSPERRTMATSLTSLGPSLGVIAVNLFFPLIVSQFNTWRLPFLIFAIAGILFALALLLLGREGPLRRPATRFHPRVILEVFQHRPVWLCYGLQFIRFGVLQGITFWLPSLLLNEKGFPLQLTGLVISLQSIIGAPCNLLGAYFADRFKKPALVIGISMLMLGFTAALLVNLDSMPLIIAAVFVNAIFTQMYFGPLFTLASEMLGAEKMGITNGVSNMFAITGGLVTAYLMGVLRDNTGSFQWGFYSIAGLCAIGLVLSLILARYRRQKMMPASGQE
jgi:nitrate/nitrite transporter NarK